MELVIATANCQQSNPTEPSIKAKGMKTTVKIRVIPIMAPLIWGIALMVASLGGSPSSDIILSTFSTTTMASSTRIPMAKTIANMVNTLTEKPKVFITSMEPKIATGTTNAGIIVYRMFCKNTYMTINTNTIASSKVWTTCSIDVST